MVNLLVVGCHELNTLIAWMEGEASNVIINTKHQKDAASTLLSK